MGNTIRVVPHMGFSFTVSYTGVELMYMHWRRDGIRVSLLRWARNADTIKEAYLCFLFSTGVKSKESSKSQEWCLHICDNLWWSLWLSCECEQGSLSHSSTWTSYVLSAAIDCLFAMTFSTTFTSNRHAWIHAIVYPQSMVAFHLASCISSKVSNLH